MTLNTNQIQVAVAGYATDSPAKTFIKIDGQFGPKTEVAVRRFQRAYGLTSDGLVGPITEKAIRALADPDWTTEHFTWGELDSRGVFTGGKVNSGKVRVGLLFMMWKLEALRKKLGNKPIHVNSGYRSITHNNSVGGASNSMHQYGIACDISVAGKTPAQVVSVARTCGFSGAKAYSGHVHLDSRVEYEYGSQNWWWPGF